MPTKFKCIFCWFLYKVYFFVIVTIALACDATNGHKPTAMAALKLVITKYVQNENPDYSQCRYSIPHTP